MNRIPISSDEFKQRLARLCLGSKLNGLPRKDRDRQIMLKSIALYLTKDRAYTEPEINAALANWLGEVGQSFETDPVTLRRTLVDEKYLERSDDGRLYRLATPRCADWFAPEVDEIDPVVVVSDAIAESKAKRDQYRNRAEP